MSEAQPADQCVGVPEMDVEHALQLRLVDAFCRAVDSGPRAPGATELLRQIEDYTNTHFLAEQLLMRLHAYPAYQDHVHEHDRLIAELRQMSDAFEVGETRAAMEWAKALRSWLVTHIRTSDHALAAYLKENVRQS